MSLYGTVGVYTPEHLLADPQGADVIAIPVEPGNGKIGRGTVMYRTSGGMWAPAGADEVIASNPLAVIDEAIDSDADAAVAEDARAYRAGKLIFGKVKLKADAALTAAKALILRGQGIVLDMMDATAPDFPNAFVTILYKANGGTGADVTAEAQLDSSYAIAANTFTPPAGKAFDKWNTKADGTGTNYAPAASYAAGAGLTLFAIWKDA